MKKTLIFLFTFAFSAATAQNATTSPGKYPPVVNFTIQEEHQNMLKQLGIKSLRSGPSGDESAPNHANYDEALANPYPNLPEVLTLKNGKKVTTPAMCWKQRRPEIVEAFEKEVFGRTPKNVSKVNWKVLIAEREMVGLIQVIAKNLVGQDSQIT